MSDAIHLIAAKQLVTVDETFGTPANPLGVIEDAVMVFDAEKILWVGERDRYPENLYSDACWLIDPKLTEDKVILPGLIDSHTHPVFAGDRAKEFEQRLQGVSYQEIAANGGGIQTTVKATREASEEELFALAKKRLERMLSFGVTSVEAKSGYGLDRQSELKSLRVIARLQQALQMRIVPTYMGAHDIPDEYKANPDQYVQRLCDELIPEVAESALAEFCDVFCDEGYFNAEQSRAILQAAQNHGLGIRIHADEFKAIGGCEVAGDLKAASADHLLNITDSGIAALKAGETVATLLPGTAFYLRLPYAPAKKILEAGIPLALATDFNPGSCMSENLQLVMTLACLQMRMTPAEVIKAVTIQAAKALKLEHQKGSLALGKSPDFVVFDVANYQELLYHFGVNFVEHVVIGATLVHTTHARPPLPCLSSFD
ncbi:MAG: imidazolonepropionase [Vampirovibrionales bacterium]|nr:imidazolonepropionase [Vampirovibrionales bacterium]